ncbi:MAG TPA: Wzy polymerase domain-containing protein [Burkholderiaceae bacterium]|nr:Wzy polymerase domain-containing protein [Burkholderiaceae bacterium]
MSGLFYLLFEMHDFGMKRTIGWRDAAVWESILLALLMCAWLIPNHYPPWMAFHSNAWASIALAFIGIYCLRGMPKQLAVPRASLALLLLAITPLLQYSIGLMPLKSNAIITALVLFGFAVCYQLSYASEACGQEISIGYLVIMAMTFAAIGSTGIASYQWLGYAKNPDLFEVWILPFYEGSRPYANLAQPNQLATLLLCGIMGIGLLWGSRRIGNLSALLGCGWILWGIAMTQSRHALLTLSLWVLACSFFPPKDVSGRVKTTIWILFGCYVVALFSQGMLGRILNADIQSTLVDRNAGEIRLMLWQMALAASTKSFWIGYGWGKSNLGYFGVYLDFKEAIGNIYFEQSHNLILDLALWVGWPIAALILVLSIVWLSRLVKATSSLVDYCILGCVLAFGVHAMLEFPLNYPYFLLPFGCILGLIAGRLGPPKPIVRISKNWMTGVVVGMLVITVVIVIDYLRVEAAFSELRFQVAKIGSGHDESPPRTIVLVDWPDAIALFRATPRTGMSQNEIQHWENLMLYATAPLSIRKVIGAYRVNGYSDEARIWAERSCWLLSEKACAGLYDEWETRKNEDDMVNLK